MAGPPVTAVPSIIFLVASASRRAGGMFHSVRGLARACAAAGAEVRALALRDEFSDEDAAAWDPVPLELFPVLGPERFGWSPALKRRLDALLAEGVPSVLSSHGLWMWTSAVAASAHAPRIVHPHGMLDGWALRHRASRKRLAWRLYEERNLRGAAAIRALNDSEAFAVVAALPGATVRVLPNAVELSEPPATIRGDVPERFLFLGRLHEKKGIRELIEAWSALRFPMPELIIAGPDQGGCLASLQRDARTYSVEDRVRFAGPVDGEAKEALLRSVDAFVLPSRSEGMSMAVLEAAAHGVPLLLTEAVNMREFFAIGGALNLGALPDAGEIAAGVERFRAMPQGERAAMAANARALVSGRYRWDLIASDFLELSARVASAEGA
ncbi:MAG: glycosyltransferase [Candidatus Sumerlaeia bacterium]|nr:glycosyltransferase [Candidatus Sumerlaeia bacterium]